MGIVDRPNHVPELQRKYQAAYRQHMRIWKISHRSKYFMMPFTVMMWGTLGASLYAMGRKVGGYNSFFGDK